MDKSKQLPTPTSVEANKNSEEGKQKRFNEMYLKFAEEALKETGYIIHPQIGPDGAFNAVKKIEQDETSK